MYICYVRHSLSVARKNDRRGKLHAKDGRVTRA